MKKALVLIFGMILFFSFVSAADLSVNKVTSNDVIIKELGNNASFLISITNEESQSDSFQIYSLVGVVIHPKGFFEIKSGETVTLDVKIVPYESTVSNTNGLYIFEYQIKGLQTGFYKENLAIKILGVKDAVDVSVDPITLEDDSVLITVRNKEKVSFSDLSISGKSDFFEFSEVFNLGPEESVEINVPVDLSNALSAGEYSAEITYEFNGIGSSKEVDFDFLEKRGILFDSESEGFIVRRENLTKTNLGNIPTPVEITVTKNVLTRLFTVYSVRPDSSERRGLFVDYSWERELDTRESFTVVATTNYTIPFILILIVIIVAFATRYFVSKKLSLRKRVSLMRTKGGEFALKVTLRAKARKELLDISISDRVPGMTKLHKNYGTKPTRVDPKSRRLHWEIPRLNAGEERTFTYVIYSKINVVGRFELPVASASYKSDGKTEHSHSNKTSYAAEVN